MPEKDLDSIIRDILESSEPMKSPRGEAATIVKGGKYVKVGGRMLVDRRKTFIVRRRKRRSQRNPLRTSLRLIVVGLIVLCVPLLFSVKDTQPPRPTITGTIDAITPDQVPVIHPAQALTPTGPLTVVPYQPGFHCYAGCSFFKPAQPIDPTAASRPQDI